LAASSNNQSMPNPALPNNLLAPFWTDLDLSVSGNWYRATVSDGTNQYHVFEWENAPLWAGVGVDASFTFQIWIQVGTDNIWYAYGDMIDDGWTIATVGAENETGTLGATYYYNGSGSFPSDENELFVHTSPAIFTFEVKATGPVLSTIVNEVEVDDGDTILTAWAATRIIEPIVYGVRLEPDSDAGSARPGETVVYELQVINEGEVPDTFTLSYSGNQWNVALSAMTTGELQPGESFDLTVMVTAPADAADGAMDVVTVTATSTSNPDVSDDAVLTTTVEWYRIFMPLVPKS
jgi:hypothetical protein